MSSLEKDFDVLLKQLNAKLAEAAKVMKEVNELRVKAGLESLIFSRWMNEEASLNIRSRIEDEEGRCPGWEEVDDEVQKLREVYEQIKTSDFENEVKCAGWSTSSSYC